MAGDGTANAIRSSLGRMRVTADQVTELRVPNVPTRYGRPLTVAGWFDDVDALTDAALELEARGAPGVYITLNPVNPLLLGRAYNRLVESPKAATADADVVRRTWLPFDFDPVRPAGVSSTESQCCAARERAIEAAKWLTTELGEEPDIWACSGNGYHLLFRADLPNTAESTATVKALIGAAADRFSDDHVSVDRTVFNAGRIWKVYGTVARKGDEVPKLGLVHRRAQILGPRFEDDLIG